MGTPLGQATAVKLLTTVVPHGVVGGGPPCTMFISSTAVHHRRTNNDPVGNEGHEKTRLANEIARFWTKLLRLAVSRDVFFWVEQPNDSFFFKCPWWVNFVAFLAVAGIPYFVQFIRMGGYDALTPKPTDLVGTLPALPDMNRVHVPPSCTLRLTYRDKDGKSHGNKKLMSQSQQYTEPFCRILSLAILRMWATLPLDVQHSINPCPHFEQDTSELPPRQLTLGLMFTQQANTAAKPAGGTTRKRSRSPKKRSGATGRTNVGLRQVIQ